MQTLISQSLYLDFLAIKHEKTDARDLSPADFSLFRRSKQRVGLGEGCENNSQLPHPFALEGQTNPHKQPNFTFKPNFATKMRCNHWVGQIIGIKYT